ncbi:MAG: sigma-70 family RNA polymerase sigma factor [Cyclobacteriaceae bacterium]
MDIVKDSHGDYSLKHRKESLADTYVKHREEFIQWSIRRYNVTADQAMEVYQESVVIFYENLISGKIEVLSSSAKTYLFAIGKNKLREFFRTRVKLTQQDEQILERLSEEPDSGKEPFFKIMEKNFLRLNERCRELLSLFYFEQMTMDQISDQLSYKNVDSTKNQKYKCLKQLRDYCEEEVTG